MTTTAQPKEYVKLTQKKLDKLALIEEQTRQRVQRYRERAEDKGKKQISAFLEKEAHAELVRLREVTGGTFGTVIDTLLLDINSNVTITTVQDAEPVLDPDAELDLGSTDLEFNLRRIKAESGTWQEKADRLNKQKIKPKRAKKWTAANLERNCSKL